MLEVEELLGRKLSIICLPSNPHPLAVMRTIDNIYHRKPIGDMLPPRMYIGSIGYNRNPLFVRFIINYPKKYKTKYNADTNNWGWNKKILQCQEHTTILKSIIRDIKNVNCKHLLKNKAFTTTIKSYPL